MLDNVSLWCVLFDDHSFDGFTMSYEGECVKVNIPLRDINVPLLPGSHYLKSRVS